MFNNNNLPSYHPEYADRARKERAKEAARLTGAALSNLTSFFKRKDEESSTEQTTAA